MVETAAVELRENQSFDEFAVEYDYFAEATHVPVVPWLRDLGVSFGGRAVDLGCGSGRHTSELATVFDEVVGIDLSEPLLAVARAKHADDNITYFHGDLVTYQDADGLGYDLVFSSTTLHHVPDLEAALANVRSLLRPGGWAVLSDVTRMRSPAKTWLWRHGGIYVGPFMDFLARLRSKDVTTAWRLLRFQAGRPMIRHLLADEWLTREEFAERYLEAFPGGRIAQREFPTLVWQSPVA